MFVYPFIPLQNCRIKFTEKEVEFRLLKKERENLEITFLV